MIHNHDFDCQCGGYCATEDVDDCDCTSCRQTRQEDEPFWEEPS